MIVLAVIAQLALATPPNAQASRFINYTLVVDPDANNRVQINLPTTSEYEEDVPTSHGTRSPSVFVFQDDTMYLNKSSGWHYHPGIVLITVAAGSLEWYDAKCTKKVRVAGDSFMESDQVHYVRNVSPSYAHDHYLRHRQGIDKQDLRAGPALRRDSGSGVTIRRPRFRNKGPLADSRAVTPYRSHLP